LSNQGILAFRATKERKSYKYVCVKLGKLCSVGSAPEEGKPSGHGAEDVVGGRADDETLLAGVLVARSNPAQKGSLFFHLKITMLVEKAYHSHPAKLPSQPVLKNQALQSFCKSLIRNK
jgi:hypothetical protein